MQCYRNSITVVICNVQTITIIAITQNIALP